MSNTAELQAYLNRPLADLLEELSLYAPAERSADQVWAKIARPGKVANEFQTCLCYD